MRILRFSGPVALVLALAGCAGTWEQFKQTVLPSDQESAEDIQPALPRCPFDLTTAHPDFGIRIITL